MGPPRAGTPVHCTGNSYGPGSDVIHDQIIRSESDKFFFEMRSRWRHQSINQKHAKSSKKNKLYRHVLKPDLTILNQLQSGRSLFCFY